MSLITITIDDNDYQSYVSLAEADIYLDVDITYGGAWSGLTLLEQQKRLIAATRRLDMLRYIGTMSDSAQLTQWPRSGAVDADGNAIADDVIPTAIEQATYILAGAAAVDDQALADRGRGVRSVNVPGAVSITYQGAGRSSYSTGNDQVDLLIRPLLAGAFQAPDAYNIDGANPFAEANSDLSRGFS